jgi:pyrimidine operon attenuation protein/uracil phosphoribosyltransferase
MNKIPTYYAYRVNSQYKGAIQTDPRITAIRDAIKNVTINPTDYVKLITKALINFDLNVDSLSSYSLIALPKSTSPLLKQVVESISNKYGTTVEIIDDAFLKNKIEDITVHPEIIQQVRDKHGDKVAQKTEKRYHALIAAAKVDGEFKMKKIPTEYGYRRGITNFLQINDKKQDTIFRLVNGQKVLLMDDIVTSGTTMVEMKRLFDNLGASQINLFCILGLK